MNNMRNALKVVGAVLAVIAMCAPLMFLPVEDTQTAALGYAGVTVTVPPTVVVATTIPGLETTTTTTEVALDLSRLHFFDPETDASLLAEDEPEKKKKPEAKKK